MSDQLQIGKFIMQQNLSTSLALETLISYLEQNMVYDTPYCYTPGFFSGRDYFIYSIERIEKFVEHKSTQCTKERQQFLFNTILIGNPLHYNSMYLQFLEFTNFSTLKIGTLPQTNISGLLYSCTVKYPDNQFLKALF